MCNWCTCLVFKVHFNIFGRELVITRPQHRFMKETQDGIGGRIEHGIAFALKVGLEHFHPVIQPQFFLPEAVGF